MIFTAGFAKANDMFIKSLHTRETNERITMKRHLSRTIFCPLLAFSLSSGSALLACTDILAASDDTASFEAYESTQPDSGEDFILEASGNSDSIEMYRLYNPNSGEHFYTSNAAEKNKLVSCGWHYEGIGWRAPVSSNIPVYRLYNANAGDHHYTMNAGEKNHLISVGWKYEGVGWHSSEEKKIPLYRQYNPNAKAGSHNYTTNKVENDTLVSAGWKAEGIAWYAAEGGTPVQPVVDNIPSFGEYAGTYKIDPLRSTSAPGIVFGSSIKLGNSMTLYTENGKSRFKWYAGTSDDQGVLTPVSGGFRITSDPNPYSSVLPEDRMLHTRTDGSKKYLLMQAEDFNGTGYIWWEKQN